jgi:phosphoglycerate dehydrogenase-like enzyme
MRRIVTEAALPIVLFIDDGFELAPYVEAFVDELWCVDQLPPDEGDRVVALVTAVKPVGVAEIAPFPALRMVLTCSTGVDHLDLTVLRERGLVVANTPTYCSDEVAEHALACVLAGWRGLWRLGESVRGGRWDTFTTLRRADHSRLGIIGLGRIGARLARLAQPLGIEVVGHDPAAGALDGVTMVAFHELLATSDAVSLHLPGVPGAPPLLGAAELAAMKPGALLVNLARASLVDLDAVVSALNSGALGAAAWDVWPREPPETGDPRLQTPGLLVTPHVAWSSAQADDASVAEAIAALRDALL